MSWTDDGIVWAAPGVIARISPNTGRVDTIASLKPGESAEGPEILPGGETVLYTLAASAEPDRWEKSQVIAQQIPKTVLKLRRLERAVSCADFETLTLEADARVTVV